MTPPLGLINGALIAGLRLTPFIVTLATGEVFAGLNLVVTRGYPIRPLGEQFRVSARARYSACLRQFRSLSAPPVLDY
jgi:ribose/xylose/arabinose/galactoside ABC-type transport system permease subunit